MRPLPGILIAFGLASYLVLAGKPSVGKYLYTEPNPADTGALRVRLTAGSPRADLAVAVAQESHSAYRGTIEADGTILFPHLPVDKYDLLIVTGHDYYEGFRLVAAPLPTLAPEERTAIVAEIDKIEGFFDHKLPERIAVDADNNAGTFVQQYRAGLALQQSGKKVAGTIHSLDLVWFAKPLKGWQLVERRQIYREELDFPEPLAHHFLATLSNHRVVNSPAEIGPIALHQPAPQGE